MLIDLMVFLMPRQGFIDNSCQCSGFSVSCAICLVISNGRLVLISLSLTVSLEDCRSHYQTVYAISFCTVQVMSKAGVPEDELKGTIDLKMRLESAKLKFSDLTVKQALGIQSFDHMTGPADSGNLRPHAHLSHCMVSRWWYAEYFSNLIVMSVIS